MSEEKLLGTPDADSVDEEFVTEIEIPLKDDVSTVNSIVEAISSGQLPGIYQVLAGGRHTLWRVTGDPVAGVIGGSECTPHDLRAILSRPPFKPFKIHYTKNGMENRPALPTVELCRAVLADGSWTVPWYRPNPDRWALRCPNGTVNLLTGDLRESTLDDLHTCQTYVTYRPEVGVSCPRFMSLVAQVAPDPEVADTLLDSLAYLLTGSTAEQKFFWLQGKSDSGKSTVAKVMLRLLGSYATEADKDLLFGQGNEHSANLIKLEGKRLVVQDEIPDDRAMRTDQLRQFTSHNTISAHGMRENYRDIVVSWKVLIASNPKARMRTQSGDGIWRRMVLFPVRSSYSGEKVKAYENFVVDEEGPQILNLLISRLNRVRDFGIKIAEAIAAEVSFYEENTDPTSEFLTAAIRSAPGSWVANEDIAWAWSKVNPGARRSSVQLGIMMHDAGYEKTSPVRCRRNAGGHGPMSMKRGWKDCEIAADVLGEREVWRRKSDLKSGFTVA